MIDTYTKYFWFIAYFIIVNIHVISFTDFFLFGKNIFCHLSDIQKFITISQMSLVYWNLKLTYYKNIIKNFFEES